MKAKTSKRVVAVRRGGGKAKPKRSHFHSLDEIYHLMVLEFGKVNTRIDAIMVTQAEAITRLDAISVTLDKIATETAGLQQLIADLRTALENAGALNPEVEAALARVEEKAKGIDDLVEDAAPPA